MLSKRIASERKKINKTQAEVAKSIGIARTTYAMYEQGKREPDYATLEKLANFFDVSIDYLLGRTEESQDKNSKDNKLAGLDENVYALARNIQDLDPESQDALSKLIESMRKRGREAKDG